MSRNPAPNKKQWVGQLLLVRGTLSSRQEDSSTLNQPTTAEPAETGRSFIWLAVICFAAFASRSLAEAGMEALERENNAKEALGVNNTAGEAAECEGTEGGDASDRPPSHVDAISPSAGDGGEEATTASCRLVALQRSVESKVGSENGREQARMELYVLVCAPIVLRVWRVARQAHFRFVP